MDIMETEMVKKSDLKDLTSKHLKDLRGYIDEMLAERQDREKQEGRQKVQAIAEELGISIYDLVGIQKQGKGRPKGDGTRTPAKAKYRLPNGETWSGKGRIPLALREALDGAPGWDAGEATFEDKEARDKALSKFLL